MTSQAVLNIGPGVLPDFVSGASLTAILAYPKLDDAIGFHKVRDGLCGGVVRMTLRSEPEQIALAEQNWPQVNWSTLRELAQKRRPAVGHLGTRLRHRMAAGRAGIAKAYRQIYGVAPKLPAGITSTTITQLCEMIASDVEVADADDIERQVVRPSLPILHIAMACQIVMFHMQLEASEYQFDIQDADFFQAVVGVGTVLENVVHDHPSIPMTRDRMTLVRWFG